MEWPMFHRVERRATRMHEVMDRLNVDLVALTLLCEGNAYAEARSLCLFCGSSAECLSWLDRPERGDEQPQFCPVLPRFEACKRMPVT
jgi:hypothetical protein